MIIPPPESLSLFRFSLALGSWRIFKEFFFFFDFLPEEVESPLRSPPFPSLRPPLPPRPRFAFT